MAESKHGESTKRSWRDVIAVHPAAAVFPLMSPDELQALGEDIVKNGLQVPVIIGMDPTTGVRMLLDGRNRLDAMELIGEPVVKGDDLDPGVHEGKPQIIDNEQVAAEMVIATNIRRRHLTKAQQAELIVKAIEAGRKEFRVGVSRNSKRDRVNEGRPPDPVLAAAVTEAAKVGISKGTVKAARAKLRGTAPKKVKAVPAPAVAVVMKVDPPQDAHAVLQEMSLAWLVEWFANLHAEIQRRRVDARDGYHKWRPDNVHTVRQSALLDWIEDQLDAVAIHFSGNTGGSR